MGERTQEDCCRICWEGRFTTDCKAWEWPAFVDSATNTPETVSACSLYYGVGSITTPWPITPWQCSSGVESEGGILLDYDWPAGSYFGIGPCDVAGVPYAT